MSKYRVEWLNAITGRIRVTNLNLSLADDWIVVTEGEIDALTLQQAGVLDIHILGVREK